MAGNNTNELLGLWVTVDTRRYTYLGSGTADLADFAVVSLGRAQTRCLLLVCVKRK